MSAGSYGVAELREREFPWTADHVYLNAASIGPLPERTCRAVEAFNRGRATPHALPDGFLMGALREARAAAARLIGAEVDEIALTTNTSVGVNVAAGALPIAPGEIVLVSEREFPANVYPWMLLEARGVEVELVPATPEGWPDEARLLERVADPRVRVLAVSHVQFATGYRVDLDRLGEACRAHDTFLAVDAIQALGQVPFDVRRTPVDVLACGAQKWLLSPWGSGFVYVRRGLIGSLRPPMAGWLAFEGTDDFSRLTEYGRTFRADARRFEVGTVPFQDVLGMTESLGLLADLGVARIARHLETVTAPLYAAADDGAFALTSPAAPAHRSAIVCVRPRRVDAAYQALRDAGVSCALREGALRLSPHCYNTVAEMERVVDLLRRVP